jgi:hypothetical protein
MVHPCGIPPSIHFHYAHGCQNPDTRTTVRLLGPCFKTGQLKPFRQHPAHVSDTPHPVTPPGQRPASSSSSRKKTRIEDPAKRHVWQLLSPRRQVTKGYNNSPKATYLPNAFVCHPKLMLTCNHKSTPPKQPNEKPAPCGRETPRRSHRRLNSWPQTLVSTASLLTISRTISLSFQSSFHLSLTVLVRYRSLARI